MDLDIAWHNMPPSDAVEADVRKRFAKLCTICTDVTSARISLDQPHHPQAKPHAYSVMLEIHVPNTTIVVDNSAGEELHRDLHQLIHHSFDAARRQVQDYRRIRQGKVKRHSAPAAPPLDSTDNKAVDDGAEIEEPS